VNPEKEVEIKTKNVLVQFKKYISKIENLVWRWTETSKKLLYSISY
jgi:hypothetical protein